MSAGGRSKYYIYKWFWSSLDLLYPPRCGGCDAKGARWCKGCQRNAIRVVPPLCPRCGKSQSRNILCNECRNTPPQFIALRSWAVFNGPVRHAIHRLKYRRDIALGEVLSRHMITCLEKTNWEIDLVIPVPLGVARLAERGYNQASLLAKPLALGVGLHYQSAALRKTCDTPSQVGLSLEQRMANVAGSFEAIPGIVAGKKVLVVDDVSTSGATLNACAAALLACGSESVYTITLARANYIDR